MHWWASFQYKGSKGFGASESYIWSSQMTTQRWNFKALYNKHTWVVTLMEMLMTKQLTRHVCECVCERSAECACVEIGVSWWGAAAVSWGTGCFLLLSWLRPILPITCLLTLRQLCLRHPDTWNIFYVVQLFHKWAKMNEWALIMTLEGQLHTAVAKYAFLKMD